MAVPCSFAAEEAVRPRLGRVPKRGQMIHIHLLCSGGPQPSKISLPPQGPEQGPASLVPRTDLFWPAELLPQAVMFTYCRVDSQVS
jgi:hypothetical protein